MTPSWRHWFEAEPLGKGKATPPEFCFRAGRALAEQGFWEAFWGPTSPFTPPSPSTRHQQPVFGILPGGNSWQQVLKGAVHSQRWKCNVPTLKASSMQSSMTHPDHTTREGNTQEKQLGQAELPDKEHLPAQLCL